MEDPDGLIGHIRDETLGDVLVLRKANLPTMDAPAGAEWLGNQGISGVTARTLVRARVNGDLLATAVGSTYLFSERDLLEWVQSLRGVDKFAARREATRAHHAAKKAARKAREEN